jgi:hypothetical protein
MWAYDFDNKQVVRELGLNKNSAVDWMNMCREICEK